MNYKENIFRGKKDIKYLLFTEESKDLLIVFSSYVKEPQECATYTYVEKLNNIKSNKLFILDDYGYKKKGCWYLGEDGRLSVENSVIRLIVGVIKSLRIKRDNIIIIGADNAGFASLYFGIKYKFKNIVSAAPQILLGNYLKDKPEIMTGILGHRNKDYTEVLNNLILSLEIPEDCNIYLYSGSDNNYFDKDIRILNEKVKNKKCINLDFLHGKNENVVEEFGKIIENEISNIISNNFIYDDISLESKIGDNISVKLFGSSDIMPRLKINLDKNKLSFNMKAINKNYMYASYLYLNGKNLYKAEYKKYPEFNFNIDSIGKYKLVLYIRDKNKDKLIVDIPLEFATNISDNIQIRIDENKIMNNK